MVEFDDEYRIALLREALQKIQEGGDDISIDLLEQLVGVRAQQPSKKK